MPTKKLAGLPQDPPEREDSAVEGGSDRTSKKISLVREAMRLGLDLSALRLDQFAPRDGEHAGTNGAPLGTEEIRRRALETLHLLDEYNRVKLEPSKASLGTKDDLLEGVESLDDFLAALDTSKEKGGEKKAEPQEKYRREELAGRIKELLSEPQVYQLLRQSLTKETERFVAVQPLLSRLHKLRQVQEIAFERIHTLSLESKRQHGKIVGSVQTTIEKLSRLSREAEEEELRLEEEASPLEKGWIASQRLLEYKQQLKKDRFVMTPSRRAILDDMIAKLGSKGRVLLLGSNGTGKTELAAKALKLVSNGYHLVPWQEATTGQDIFGRQEIRRQNGHVESGLRPGPMTRAIEAKGNEPAGVLHDELNLGSLRTIYLLKKLWNSRPGQEVDVPVLDEKRMLPLNYAEVYTANPKDERTSNREEFDAGITRVLGGMNVPFLAQNEQEQIILAKLIDENGVLHLSKSEAQTIRELVASAVMTQQCFDRAFADLGDEALAEIKSMTGISDLRLTKKFLDPGRLMEMFDTYEQKRAEGMNVADYLSAELKRFFAEFEVEEERNIALAILKLKGVLTADSTAVEPHVQVMSKPGEKPYLLPSELAFVVSCDDELDDSDIEFDQPEVSVEDVIATDGAELLELLNTGRSTVIKAAPIKRLLQSQKAIDRARQMMLEKCGDGHFYGPEELMKAFPGLKLNPKDIPELPPDEEIERHAAQKHTLRLRVSNAPDGSKLTIPKMREVLLQEFARNNDGEVLYNPDADWKRNSTFYTDEVPELAWAFTSDDVLANSTSKNHLQQTQLLAEYAKTTLFKKGQLPPEYQEAIRELEAQQAEIQRLMVSDWKAAADRLAKLKINTLMRGNPAETVQDMLVTFMNSDPAKRKRLLKKMWTWTATQSSDGHLVRVGDFGRDGVLVNDDQPGRSDGGLGVVLSRKFPRTLRT
jgi:hypothetical protein